MDKNLSKMVIAPPPCRFTLSEWELNNRTRTRFVKDQQQLADRILASSELLLDHTDFQLLSNKEDTDFDIKGKIETYKFKISEIVKIRRRLEEEIDAINLATQRIMNALAYIEKEGLYVCKTCLALREVRIGIDLVFDQVEKELLKERDIIEGCLSLLKKLLQQACEQVRILRASLYLIDHELKDKEVGQKIDENNLFLTEKCLNLSVYHGNCSLANS